MIWNKIFSSENIVICQFDKIARVRNKWRFQLVNGIMTLNGKDYVFQKATGDGEWWNRSFFFEFYDETNQKIKVTGRQIIKKNNALLFLFAEIIFIQTDTLYVT